MLRATQGSSPLLSLVHAALPGMLLLLALSLPRLTLGGFPVRTFTLPPYPLM